MTDSKIEYVRGLLDLLNVTYTVSNKGREIRFSSKLRNNDVILYPTTGTFIHNKNVYKSPDLHNLESIKNNIRRCLKYHINERL